MQETEFNVYVSVQPLHLHSVMKVTVRRLKNKRNKSEHN